MSSDGGKKNSGASRGVIFADKVDQVESYTETMHVRDHTLDEWLTIIRVLEGFKNSWPIFQIKLDKTSSCVML